VAESTSISNTWQTSPDLISHSIEVLRRLQHASGLFSAASKNSQTGYSLAWIRDNIYATLGFEAVGDTATVVRALRALLDILKQHEDKINWMIKEPEPKHSYRYIHARYNPITGQEIWGDWGNKQNDAVGAFLFAVGDLELRGITVLRHSDDLAMIQKLVNYLEAIEYWHDLDNGMWEEAEDIHASSIGACVAGLRRVQVLVDVDPALIRKGESALNELLPRESPCREVDLALLSLIYPYNVVSPKQRDQILRRVEYALVRERGVLRYQGDQYYTSNTGCAEWTMGLCWLAIIYKKLGKPAKHAFYLRKAMEAMTPTGELPELYYGGSHLHNDNCPLAWAQSLFVVASVR